MKLNKEAFTLCNKCCSLKYLKLCFEKTLQKISIWNCWIWNLWFIHNKNFIPSTQTDIVILKPSRSTFRYSQSNSSGILNNTVQQIINLTSSEIFKRGLQGQMEPTTESCFIKQHLRIILNKESRYLVVDYLSCS